MDELKASQKAEMKPLREKADALIEKLKDQIKNKASDADIKGTLDEVTANHDAMKQIENKYEQSRSSILTPMQQAKMVVRRMKQHNKMEKKEKKEKADNEK
jgi:Spy/CpxP family protein refolding chaperone